MRSKLYELLVVVTLAGLVSIGMLQGGRTWETVIFSLTLGVLLVAILLAIGATVERRKFWLAFAVAAGSYLAFAHVADENDVVPRRDGPEFTTRVLCWTVQQLHDDLSPEEVRTDLGGGGLGGGLFSVGVFDDVARIPAVDEGNDDDPFGPAGKPDILGITVRQGRGVQVVEPPDLNSQFRIGHCGWALLFGWLSGHLATWLSRRSVPRPT